MTNDNMNIPIDSEEKPDISRRDAIKTMGMLGLGAAALGMTGGVGSALAQESGEATAKKYAGKTAFITGGARGIGLATGKLLAEHGANVVLYDVATPNLRGVDYPMASEDDLRKAEAEIKALGAQCLAIKGDVRSKAALQQAMNQTVSSFGTLDFLVVNAGVTQIGDIAEFNEDQVDNLIDINVSGVVKTTQAAVPIMRKQKSGRMIFISSGLGRRGHELFPVYSATRWAVIGLAKSTGHALAKDGIMCNTVCPGLVNTPLANNSHVLNKWLPHDPTWEAVDKIIRENSVIPMGAYEPEDIAKAVELFCDPITAQVTGEVFDIGQGAAVTMNA